MKVHVAITYHHTCRYSHPYLVSCAFYAIPIFHIPQFKDFFYLLVSFIAPVQHALSKEVHGGLEGTGPVEK